MESDNESDLPLCALAGLLNLFYIVGNNQEICTSCKRHADFTILEFCREGWVQYFQPSIMGGSVNFKPRERGGSHVLQPPLSQMHVDV